MPTHIELVTGKTITVAGTDASIVVKSLDRSARDLVEITDSTGAAHHVNAAHVVQVFTTPERDPSEEVGEAVEWQ